MQFLSSIGMTDDYMHQNRRGFSTLALDLRLVAGRERWRPDRRTDVDRSSRQYLPAAMSIA